MTTPLEFVLLLLLASVVGVVVFQSLNLPSILGYLTVGFFVGPHVMRLTGSQHIEAFAEFGVVFLMFSVGLEFSIRRLKTMGRAVFGLGFSQVSGSILLVMLITFILKPWLNVQWATSFAIGSTLSLSSTAIVIKMLREHLELDSEHGKNIVGILIFQDLAVVPLLIITAALGTSSDNMFYALSIATIKISITLGLLLFLGKKILGYLLTAIARRQSQELFVLSLLLITLGAAYLSDQLGLSMAFGSFVTGVLIADTPFRRHVEENVQAFRDVLLGLFFITTGMLLNPTIIINHPILVTALLLIPVIFKLLFISFLTRLFGASKEASIKTGLCLAQAGEFGFVLLNLSLRHKLINSKIADATLAAMLLSMIIGPFLIQHANNFVLKWLSFQKTNKIDEEVPLGKETFDKRIIVCGYGPFGQDLGSILEEKGHNYIALDMDPDLVHQGIAKGKPVIFGNASSRDALKRAGIERASALVITQTNEHVAIKILCLAKELNMNLPIVVRVISEQAIETFLKLGASKVISEPTEKSDLLAAQLFLLINAEAAKEVNKVH